MSDVRQPSLIEALPTFDRETDMWGKRPAWTRQEVEAHRELGAAFADWTGAKGVFFDTDTRLADAIAGVLGFDLRFGDGEEPESV